MTYIVIIVLYLVLISGVGYLASRGVSDDNDWAVAGRSLGVLASAGTYFTTVLSAVSFIGYMGYYYKFGWGGWWNWAGTLISTILLAAFFAAKLRKFGGVTLSDFLEIRYGKPHAAMAAVLILFSTVLFTMAQLVASAVLINTITGMPIQISTIVIGAVFILFTIKGGLKAVAWTSTITSVLILFGAGALMYAILKLTGGIGALHVTLAQTNPDALDPFAGGEISGGLALSWCVTWGLGNFGMPHIVTRFNACKDEKVARLSLGFSGIAFIIFYGMLMIIGLGAMVLFPGIGLQDAVAPFLLKEIVHPVIGGIVLAAILGAAISTADSVLLQAGTTAAHDLYQKYINPQAEPKQVLKISQISTLAVGIIAVGLSLFNSATVLTIQASMVGILGSMLAMTVILGFAWKRANAKGGLAGMVAGIATALLWYALGQPFGWMPILPAIVTSSIANIVVSLATAPPPQAVVDRFFEPRQRGRVIS